MYNNLTKITVILLCVFISISANSQSSYFTSSNLTKPDLTVKETFHFDRITTNQYLSENYLIELNDLSSSQNDGLLEVDFPNSPCGKMNFQVSQVNYTNENEFEWYGEFLSSEQVDSCFCKSGTFIMLSNPTGKIGHLTIDDSIYEISSISDRLAILSKVETALFPETECQALEGSTINNHQNEVNTRENGNCDIRCLFLYTDEALELDGTINNLINRAKMGIVQTNLSLKNSDIFECDTRVEYAGLEPFDFESSPDIVLDITEIRDNPDFFEIIDSLRDIHEADIAVLFTQEYNNAFGAGLIDLHHRPYAIVTASVLATTRFTMTHEIGHIFGGRDKYYQPGVGYEYGHEFKTGNFLPCIFGKFQHTIMDGIAPDENRILHYSNPDVTYDDVDTGIEDEADMARRINDNACIISQLRETIIPFSVSLTGDHYNCPCDLSSVYSTITGGTAGAIYTYDWSESIDGINWTAINQNSSSIQVNVSCSIGITKFVKLTVTSSDGNLAESYSFSTKSALTWPNQDLPCAQFQEDDDWDDNLSLKIYPNPSFTSPNILIQIKKAGNYTIKLKDMNGKVIEILTDNEYLDLGEYLYTSKKNVQGLSFLEITNGENTPKINKIIGL